MPTYLRSTRSLLALLLALLVAATVWVVPAGAAPRGSQPAGDQLPDRILVRFDADAPASARAAARRDAGAIERSTIDQLGVRVWQVPEHAAARALAALQRDPHVDFAELDARVELDTLATVAPNDPELSRQWGADKVEAPAAWALSRSTRDVAIAILDTGVEAVPDLAGKLLPGRNVFTGTSDVMDDHGHGTASASVAGAATDNGLLVAGYGWNASILPVKVMENGSGTMSALATGIVWATDNGADVISMSLSGTSGTTTVQDAVRYAADRGVVLVAAAGNQGDSVQRYPAAYPEVIAVAATDVNDARYSWSNYGSWVDVAAPGVNRAALRDGGVYNYAGTSSATPVVAGTLALGAPYASGAQLRTALQASATPLPFVAHGRIDAYAMLRALGVGDVASPPASEEPGTEPAPEPIGPTADFTATCDLLSCRFTDQSRPGDVAITSWAWRFGDGSTGTGANVDHAYAASGSYTVRLTTTDGNGLHSSVDRVVTVTAPEPEPAEPTTAAIDLRATGSKTKGSVYARLAWTGSTAAKVDIHVDGVRRTTVGNSGSYTHDPKTKGNPTITYRVCDAGSTSVCSAPVTVSSW